MIRARESSDRWARRAVMVLDEAKRGRGIPEDIEWALAYLGDSGHRRPIPSHMHGSGRVTPPIAQASA